MAGGVYHVSNQGALKGERGGQMNVLCASGLWGISVLATPCCLIQSCTSSVVPVQSAPGPNTTCHKSAFRESPCLCLISNYQPYSELIRRGVCDYCWGVRTGSMVSLNFRYRTCYANGTHGLSYLLTPNVGTEVWSRRFEQTGIPTYSLSVITSVLIYFRMFAQSIVNEKTLTSFLY